MPAHASSTHIQTHTHARTHVRTHTQTHTLTHTHTRDMFLFVKRTLTLNWNYASSTLSGR